MIVVTGAAGRLGKHVVDQLILKGVDPDDIVAVVRRPARAGLLAERGVRIRYADYTDPDSLRTAFAGSERVLLISSNAARHRLSQHRNVVKAAVDANVDVFGYTSMLRADDSGIGLAVDHRGTEQLIAEYGLPAVILRNGWYVENYTENLATDLATGVHLGSAGEGRVAAAPRRDYAAAAAEVMTSTEYTDRTLELAGDSGFTMAELTETVTMVSGKPVIYTDLSSGEHVKALVDAGLPEQAAELYADWDAGIARGDLDVAGHMLRKIIGRDTTPLAQAVTDAINGGSYGQPSLLPSVSARWRASKLIVIPWSTSLQRYRFFPSAILSPPSPTTRSLASTSLRTKAAATRSRYATRSPCIWDRSPRRTRSVPRSRSTCTSTTPMPSHRCGRTSPEKSYVPSTPSTACVRAPIWTKTAISSGSAHKTRGSATRTTADRANRTSRRSPRARSSWGAETSW